MTPEPRPAEGGEVSHSTNCDHRIGLKTLLFSVIPMWVACPRCDTELTGKRLVRFVVLGQSLLLAAVFVFLGIVLATSGFILAVIGEPGLSIGMPTILVSLLAAVLIIWLSGLILVARFVKFVEVSGGRTSDRLIRNYLLASGVVSFIVAVWAVIYAGYSPITVAFLVIWLMIPFLLLYRFYDIKLGRRTGRGAFLVLILGAGILNLSSLIFAVYAGVNFPKTGDFEESLIFPVVAESEEEAWHRLRELLDTETPERHDVLELLASNVVALPKKEAFHGGKYAKVTLIAPMYEYELAEIEELITQGRESEAEARYTRLWKATGNFVTGGGSLINHLVARNMIASLVDFQIGSEPGPPIPSSPELIEISAHVSSELDGSFEKAMAFEYQATKSSLHQAIQIDCRSHFLNLCYFELKWPFFDLNKFLKEDHSFYLAMVTDSRDPTSRLTEEIIRDRWAGSDVPKVSLFDPVSTGLRAITTPLISKFSEGTLSAVDSVLIFSYLFEYRLSGNLGNPPVDHFNGLPFIVHDKGDTIEVTSARLEEDEPAVKYRIQKLAR